MNDECNSYLPSIHRVEMFLNQRLVQIVHIIGIIHRMANLTLKSKG
jgi:hypothetical protein